jgi:hypothetical protein
MVLAKAEFDQQDVLEFFSFNFLTLQKETRWPTQSP